MMLLPTSEMRGREKGGRRTDRSLRRAALAGQMRSKIVTALELKLRLYIYFGRKPKGISLDLPFCCCRICFTGTGSEQVGVFEGLRGEWRMAQIESVGRTKKRN